MGARLSGHGPALCRGRIGIGIDAPGRAFHQQPGGYFAGMLRKYEKGELRLAGSLWALREVKWGKRRKSMH
jgi:hypothetical protein